MNIKKFLTSFILLTTILSKTIHYHYHLSSSPSSKLAHKSQNSHKAALYLKTSSGKIVKPDLSLYQIPQPNLTPYKLDKRPYYDRRSRKNGWVITRPGGGMLSHAFKKVSWRGGYGGLGELWNVEKANGGSLYRGDGGESRMYLSNAGGRLKMSYSKGKTEVWK